MVDISFFIYNWDFIHLFLFHVKSTSYESPPEISRNQQALWWFQGVNLGQTILV